MKTPDDKAVKVATWVLIVVVVLFFVTRLIRFVLQ
jgi:hypothetical protein